MHISKWVMKYLLIDKTKDFGKVQKTGKPKHANDNMSSRETPNEQKNKLITD